MRDTDKDNRPLYSAFVDAAYNETLNTYATAFTIFDPSGKMWAAGYQRINPSSSIMAAELNDINNGVNFWKEHQTDPIISGKPDPRD